MSPARRSDTLVLALLVVDRWTRRRVTGVAGAVAVEVRVVGIDRDGAVVGGVEHAVVVVVFVTRVAERVAVSIGRRGC